MSFVKRHRIVSFFVLAYVLAWGAVPFDSFFAPGALLAALMVVSATEGVAGLRDLGSRLIRWRVHWKWYAFAVTVPLLVHLVAASANVGSVRRVRQWISSPPGTAWRWPSASTW